MKFAKLVGLSKVMRPKVFSLIKTINQFWRTKSGNFQVWWSWEALRKSWSFESLSCIYSWLIRNLQRGNQGQHHFKRFGPQNIGKTHQKYFQRFTIGFSIQSISFQMWNTFDTALAHRVIQYQNFGLSSVSEP